MGFLPFVNDSGRRVVRWHRLVLAWVAVILACLAGTAITSYGLMGAWDSFAPVGFVLGVFFCAIITVNGFMVPVEKLPPIR
jgi:hypothetical protein